MNQSNEQWRKDAHQKDLQRLRGFRPIDDTFMRGLFRENLPLAELVLRIITGKPDLVLTHCETQADMYFDLLAEKTRYLKENQEGVNEMCRAMEELREESFERGREEGRELGLEEGHRNQALTTAKNLARLGMSVEQIAGAINFSPEIVSGWLTSDSIPESAN